MTINDYKKELELGFVGQVEYRLHKDKSWIAQPFRNYIEKLEIEKKLKKDNYKVETITLFKQKIWLLENQSATSKQRLESYCIFLHKLKTENNE